MPLPVLGSVASDTDLIRLYHRAMQDRARQLATEEMLDFGLAFASNEFRRIEDANCLLEVRRPVADSPAQIVRHADEHFAAADTRCLRWVISPSETPSGHQSLEDHLLSLGYQRIVTKVMHIRSAAAVPEARITPVQIIPARASHRHATEIYAQWSAELNEPQIAPAALRRLDDPRDDLILALIDGEAVGCAGILTVADAGLIDSLYVVPARRRSGIGGALLASLLAVAARSQFRQVLAGITPSQFACQKMLADAGFTPVGDVIQYVRA